MVDDLDEGAQFVYLLLHNEKIRSVIDTTTSKVVLILGRFSRMVLDALRDGLRNHNSTISTYGRASMTKSHRACRKPNGGSPSMTAGGFSTLGARTRRRDGWRASCSTWRDGRPGGLVWQLKGERVGTLGEDRARLTHGRMIKRQVRT